ncbi:MAG TPA: heme-binding protein [Propionibacteriaceae bacterium]|nr:heme-binding protein [Propionibacteriaceae bacterium]
MTEQQPYDVLVRFPGFELRRYPAHLVAEVEVQSSFTNAGNDAFGILAAFISGRNSTRAKVAMTAPVVQERGSRIAMTSPVIQGSGGESGRQIVGFVMPAAFTMETLPAPTDPRVSVREVPTEYAAAKTFTGRWTERSFTEQLADLRRAVTEAGLEICGHARYARFDPPWTPWFLRRNEVVLPVVYDPASPSSGT